MRMLALAVALGACGGSDSGPTGPITGRVSHYDLAFDVDTRVAHATVTVDIEVGGDCLTLPFRGTEVDVANLKIDGDAMRTVAIDVGAGTIQMCGSGYRAGSQIAFEIDHVIPMQTLSVSQVGYSVTTDQQGNSFYYLVSWIGGCDQFGPCDSRPDQFATYTFHVTHPVGYLARCAGTITDVSATETQCDFTADGGPTYSTFGVAVYPLWTQTPTGKWGSVDVTLYDRAATGIAARLDST